MKKILTLIIVLLYQYNIYAFTFNKEEPVYYFTNHDNEIASLREKLLVSKIVGVTGITGIGKSEMVRQYVKEYGSNYDIIIFIDTNLDLISQFIMVAKEINKQICTQEGCHIAEDAKNAKQSLMSYLNTKDKWLLIFDNLHVNENDKIKDIIDWSHKGHIIICSQDDKYLLQKVPAPYLKEKETKIIINKIMKNPSQDLIDKLTKTLQGYPSYIISHSAIFLQNNTHMSVEEYMNHMKKSENKLKTHLELVLIHLSQKAKDLLFDISLLNNQKVPRWLLEEVSNDKEKVTDTISELIRFGLVEQISEDRNNQVYRVHDSIKNELLSDNNKLDKKYIDNLLSKVQKLIPEVIPERVGFFQKDSNLEGNIEILLSNADLYKANIYKIMELREKMLWYYLIGVRQYQNAKKMVDWLDNNKKYIIIENCNEKEKASYIQYLTFSGAYKYFGENQKPEVAMKYFEEAEKIAKNLHGHEEEKTYIYTTEATIQLDEGDIQNAKENIEKALKIRPEVPKIFLGVGSVEYNKSKLYMAEGKYQEALDMVLIDIKESEAKFQSSKDISLFPEYIMQAKILNCMARGEEAYDVINNKVYNHIKDYKKGEITNIILVRTLTELSISELLINKKELALIHATEAVSLLINDKERNNKDLDNSKDIFLPPALIARGNALVADNRPEEAMLDYKLAKNIYWNIYGIKNIRNMNNVSYLFAQGAKAACKLSDAEQRKIEYNYFYGLLVRYFGVNHPRTIEVKGLCTVN